MKLIFCPHCQDIVKLHEQITVCVCGKSWGRYTNGLHARYSGDAVPLGLSNVSLVKAINNQPESGDGECFEAFVISKTCPTFRRVKNETSSTFPNPPQSR